MNRVRKILKKSVAVILSVAMTLSVFVVQTSSVSAAGALTVPTVDTTNVGYDIQRTMHLLKTSTAENPNTVKIAFYGQSLIDPNNKWPEKLITFLKGEYPSANIVWNNLAVGGFSAPSLRRMVEDDMKAFYPDLTVFMDYGEYSAYADILRYIRTYTVSEVMFVDDHFTGGDVDPNNLPKQSLNVSTTIPNLCEEFSCELVDAQQYFIKYCADNKVSSATYLAADNVHFNDVGQELMYNIIKQYFVYRQPKEEEKFLLETSKTLEVDKDINWVDGKLTIPEDGNRYVAVMGDANDYAADVTVNGKKTSKILEAYYHTRIYNGNYWNIGGFLDAALLKVPQQETWKITLTSIDSATGDYTFDLEGSKTGKDGSGSSKEVFTSNSGVISIDPADCFSAGGQYTNTDGASQTGFYKVGNQFTFDTILNGTDTLAGTKGKVQEVVLASGMKDMDNEVVITAKDATKLPDIKKIIVYRPKLTTEKTDKPKKIVCIDNSRFIEGKAKNNSMLYLKIGDKTYETVVDPYIGTFSLELPKRPVAGEKVEMYVNYFNEESEVLTVVCQPRKPYLKKVTVKSKKLEGKASPKAKVTIRIAGKKFTVKANAKGAFTLKLKKNICKKLKVDKKITLYSTVNTVKSKTKTVKIKKK